MQTHLFAVCGEEIYLSTIFPPQPAPTAAAQQDPDITEEIADKQERIAELRKEIGNAEEVFLNMEAEELDPEPDEGEEVLYAEAPQLEADLEHTRYENDAEIRTLEEEIAELEAGLA